MARNRGRIGKKEKNESKKEIVSKFRNQVTVSYPYLRDTPQRKNPEKQVSHINFAIEALVIYAHVIISQPIMSSRGIYNCMQIDF